MDSKKIKQDVDFEKLCNRMQDKLKKYIDYKINNIHNREDVLQNVFLAAVNNRNELTAHPNPEGWLMNTAKNLILKEFYKNKIIAENEEELLDIVSVEENFSEQSEMISEDIFSKLSDDEKILIKNHYEDDLTLKEIALMLNENYDTLKKRHFRLIRKARKLYEKIK